MNDVDTLDGDKWGHSGTDETEEWGVRGRGQRPLRCVCVCVRTSSTRLFRSACVRVTAVTSAPQRARARAVALPIPETQNIHKHKDLLQSGAATVTPELTHTHTHTFHTCLRLREQSFFWFYFLSVMELTRHFGQIYPTRGSVHMRIKHSSSAAALLLAAQFIYDTAFNWSFYEKIFPNYFSLSS